jgi:hypothetical protein
VQVLAGEVLMDKEHFHKAATVHDRRPLENAY